MKLFTDSGEGANLGRLRQTAAALVGGALAGFGSFYAAAEPAVTNVKEQSFRSDVLLCEAENATREKFRDVVDGLLVAEDIPPIAEPGLVAYIMARNDRRIRARGLVDDLTRPLQCNHGEVRLP